MPLIPQIIPDRFNIEGLDPWGKVLPHFMKAEAPVGHFPDRFLFRPALDHNPVHGAHRAGAVGPVLAMDQDRGTFRIRDDLQEPLDLLAFRVPGLHVEMFMSQSGRSEFVPVRMEGTKIDDGHDPMALEILHAQGGRLGTAIQIGADLE